MKQIIAKNREEAIEFAEGGNGHSQRAAYWKQDGKAFRAECVHGQKEATISDASGLWWSATITVAKKLGI